MKISDMLPSKYIKQSDVEQPTLVTITKLTTADVSQNQSGDMKWVAVFSELDKPMVLNSTNLKRIAKAHGDDSDGWIGKQMVLYVDEDVEFGGEVVGGLRLRAPKVKQGTSAPPPGKTASKAAETASKAAAFDDGAPFDDDISGI
jgi:hypothetical protein